MYRLNYNSYSSLREHLFDTIRASKQQCHWLNQGQIGIKVGPISIVTAALEAVGTWARQQSAARSSLIER